MSTFAQMHNDYLDPDRAGLNDEQPMQLHEDCTLIGYGKRGHGLNGRDADLDDGGQNVVKEAWWFSDGTIQITGSRYLTVGETEEFEDYVIEEPYYLTPHCDWDDSLSEAANIAKACAVALEAIDADSKGFEANARDRL